MIWLHSLFSQTERRLISQGAHVSAVVSLYKALGGGWLDMPVDQLIPEEVQNQMEARSHWGNLLEEPLPDGTSPVGVTPENQTDE